jgi:hypothetical protein
MHILRKSVGRPPLHSRGLSGLASILTQLDEYYGLSSSSQLLTRCNPSSLSKSPHTSARSCGCLLRRASGLLHTCAHTHRTTHSLGQHWAKGSSLCPSSSTQAVWSLRGHPSTCSRNSGGTQRLQVPTSPCSLSDPRASLNGKCAPHQILQTVA